MKKIFLLGKQLVAFGAAFSILLGPTAAAAPENSRVKVFLPEEADYEPVVSLGAAVDPKTGLAVDGYAIIHRKKGSAQQHPARGGGRRQCYAFLAAGAKWKNIEPWLVNPANGRGLTNDFVFSDLTADIAKWEDAADGVVGNGSSINILGDGAVTGAVLAADTSAPDDQNEVYFADVQSPGAIAVTIVWGIFGGPVANRRLVEWDQIYDDVDYDWSASGEAGKMDFENIVTHEIGHSFGMNDLYDAACASQTMYGYADNGEINKRTLESGDISGVSTLY